MAVRRQRAPGVDYSRATIEDRPEGIESLTILDEDGNSVSVGPDTPLPTEIDSAITENLSADNDMILNELMKMNQYLSILTGVEL
jgi:hypothetical protein